MAFTIPNNDVAYHVNLSRIFQTDLDVVVAGIGGSGVYTGGAVTIQGSPDMTLAVAAGTAIFGGTPITIGAGNVTITSADSTNPRMDLVVINTSGTKSVSAGTAATNPFPPGVPANSLVLAMVYVPAGATAISNQAQVIDKRVIIPAAVVSGDWILLASVITSGSQASVDFTSISGAYASLKVIWAAQDTHSGSSIQDLFAKINNDGTSGNYTSTSRIGSQNGGTFSSTNAATANGVAIGSIPQAGNTNILGGGEVTFPYYASSAFHKRIFSICGTDDASNNGTIYNCEARWKSNTAISRITFIAGGTAFTDGGLFSLYGLR